MLFIKDYSMRLKIFTTLLYRGKFFCKTQSRPIGQIIHQHNLQVNFALLSKLSCIKL